MFTLVGFIVERKSTSSKFSANASCLVSRVKQPNGDFVAAA